MPKEINTTVAEVLQRIQEEYAVLSQTTTFSLQALFNFGDFRLESFCSSYYPHPQSAELTGLVQAFGERYGIWLDNARYYISCALFLYPNASFDKMLAMVQNCAVDYYLNDTMGREIFAHLTPAQQHKAAAIIDRMGLVDEQLYLSPDAEPVEHANYEMLASIRDTSPAAWFREFVHFYSYHIAVTHKDNNAAALGRIPTVEEYIEMRNHTSGMPHIVLLVEYSEGAFLDWDQLEAFGMAARMRKIHRAAALIGCLMNDLFSFEKEVIKNNTDANLLASIALNHPSFSLTQVIHYGARIVREQLRDFMMHMEELQFYCSLYEASAPEAIANLRRHLAGLDRVAQASWAWQVYTRRYKKSFSIWEETQLATPAMA
ncbi:terpene synthase family protein [Chitinophaga lutea]